MTAAAAPTPVGTDDFDEQVRQSTGPVLVDFWAPWCGTCRLLAPAVRDIAAELAGRVRVVTVDAEAHPGLAADLGVRGLPTLMLFAAGQEQWRTSGSQTAAQLRERVAPWAEATSH